MQDILDKILLTQFIIFWASWCAGLASATNWPRFCDFALESFPYQGVAFIGVLLWWVWV